MLPVVTVVTPTYNAARFIARCVTSVREQSFGDWEQIIVDDGSSDDTVAIVEAFADPRIKVVRLPHRGLHALAETYNTALQHAQGSLIAILEGDDYWPREKLAIQTSAFKDPEAVICWGRAKVVDEHDRITGTWPIPREGQRSMQLRELFKVLTRKNVLVPAATVMLRRDALTAVGGFQQMPGTLYVDLPTWLAIAAKAQGTGLFLPQPLAYYRVHPTQTSARRTFDMRFQHYEIARHFVAQLNPAELRMLDWTAADEAAMEASAQLTRGIGYLHLGDHANARRGFSKVIKLSRSHRELAAATVGLLSTMLRIDLVSMASRSMMWKPKR